MENVSISLKRDWTKEKEMQDKTGQDSIQGFLHVAFEGCIYVCTVCQQTCFRDYVTTVIQLQPTLLHELLTECCTGYRSCENLEWVHIIHVNKISTVVKCQNYQSK